MLFGTTPRVTRARREQLNGHKSTILWFTGLSGAGKSTLAHAVEEHLHQLGCRTFVIDGDNVRHGLCADLGFSEESRNENTRRVGEAAKLFLEAGTIVPYRAHFSFPQRSRACAQVGPTWRVPRGVLPLPA
jgi:adenylylsulfate kinase-like enzyme